MRSGSYTIKFVDHSHLPGKKLRGASVMRHIRLSAVIASTLFLCSFASAHQYDVPVPNLAERMQLAKTGGCANCELTNADLSYKRLGSAELSGAKLHSANFMRADLQGAQFKGADLSLANFIWADLNRADFTDANLAGAMIQESRNFASAIFCRTVMPDGAISNQGC